jgi:hypothetical protein
MNYAELTRQIEREVRISGTEARQLIQDFLKEACMQLPRLHRWHKLQETVTLTLNSEDSYDMELLFQASWDITAVSIANLTFTVTGNVAPIVAAGDVLAVTGSTGNDENYVVASAAYSAGSTVIKLTTAPAVATVDGTIGHLTPYQPFLDEEAILSADGEYQKYGYKEYYALTSKTNTYSIRGTKLYLEGDAEIELLYTSIGYELTDDTDEPKPLKYYWDILKRMDIKDLRYNMGDIEAIPMAERSLMERVEYAKRHENEVDKRGMLTTVARQK